MGFSALSGLRAALIVAAALSLAASARAARAVDLQLVLAVDASASVSYDEFALQMIGLANAFRDPTVLSAIRAGAPGGIAVSVVQWSGSAAHAVAVPWMVVDDAATSASLAASIDAAPRAVPAGGTAIGDVVKFAIDQLIGATAQAARRVIDISGDGRANQGVAPEDMQALADAAGVTVNGLAILNEEPDLDSYYLQAVITGVDAFVMTARNYTDFADAIRHKLIREITGAPIVRNPVAPEQRLAVAN